MPRFLTREYTNVTLVHDSLTGKNMSAEQAAKRMNEMTDALTSIKDFTMKAMSENYSETVASAYYIAWNALRRE